MSHIIQFQCVLLPKIFHLLIPTYMQAHKTAVEKDLVRARKMAKDLLDESVVVNSESEQKMENLNVSITIAQYILR